MKKKLLACLSAALLAIVIMGLSACGTAAAPTSAKMSFGTLSTSGKTLTLELESNGTTGYEWTSSIDGEGLELSGQAVNEGSDSSDTVGAGGTTTFTYEGTGAGQATITLTYQRSWETSDSDREVSVKVTTNSSGTITSYEATDSDGAQAIRK